MKRYQALADDGRRCRRCGRRAQLFGLRDIETGWEGWCDVCNAEWRWQRSESACSHCNRLWYTSSPFLLAWGLNLNLSLVILLFLGEGYHRFLDKLCKHEHRRALTQLMWTTARLDWFPAEDSENELALEEPLGLDSLRYQYVVSSRGYVHRVESRRTLLSAVYSFLHGPLTYDKRFSYYGTPPESWQSFQDCHGKLWYYNELTREWFYACSPPAPWRRYRFASSSLECMYWWWHASERRWFFEPQ